MKNILIPLFIIFAISANAQTMRAGHYCEDSVDTKPEYVGDIFKFIGEHTRYPMEAKENGESGTVQISFVVLKDGKTTDHKVDKSVTPSLDAESLRVIKLLENWKPATKNGEPVNAQYRLPVRFILYDSGYKKNKRKKRKRK